MSVYELIGLVKVIAWPLVALLAVMVVRPHLSSLLGGAKVKLAIAGQSIETTLPEIRQIFEEQSLEALSSDHLKYLDALRREGPKQYPDGIASADRKFLRPLRNAGLVFAVPRNAFLQEATAVELSGLGRLFVRARAEAPSRAA